MKNITAQSKSLQNSSEKVCPQASIERDEKHHNHLLHRYVLQMLEKLSQVQQTQSKVINHRFQFITLQTETEQTGKPKRYKMVYGENKSRKSITEHLWI